MLYYYRLKDIAEPLSEVLDIESGTTFTQAPNWPAFLKQLPHRKLFFQTTAGMLTRLSEVDGHLSESELEQLIDLLQESSGLPAREYKKIKKFIFKIREGKKTFGHYAELSKSKFGEHPYVLKVQIYLLILLALNDNDILGSEEKLINEAIDIFELRPVVFQLELYGGHVTFRF